MQNYVQYIKTFPSLNGKFWNLIFFFYSYDFKNSDGLYEHTNAVLKFCFHSKDVFIQNLKKQKRTCVIIFVTVIYDCNINF